MKYILLTVNTDNIVPLEEILFGEENIISIIVNGVKDYELCNDNILGLYFSRWELRINLSDQITIVELQDLSNFIKKLCNNLTIELHNIEILDDCIDYLTIPQDRTITVCNNIVIVNNEEDFVSLKQGNWSCDNKMRSNRNSQNNRDIIPIFIIASTAFGTGTHETTQQCIQLINIVKHSNIKVSHALDMGTGTGILAIILAKLFNDTIMIDALDISLEAIQAVNRFSKINDVQNITGIHTQGDGEEIKNKKYNLIISNILLEPLLSLKEKFFTCLEKEGYIILSGFLAHQKEILIQEYSQIGFTVKQESILNGWVALLLQKEY